MRHNLYKFALIVVLGSGFALAQTSPQQPATPPGSSPSSPQTDQQQPSTAPDQSKPETMPNTDQKKPDDSTQKMPQSDAAPGATTGDVQGNIQSAIQKDPTLATANVTVAVSGKTVELSGSVPNKDAKDTAERIAKENSGGLKVKNHLKIASAGPESAPPPKH